MQRLTFARDHDVDNRTITLHDLEVGTIFQTRSGRAWYVKTDRREGNCDQQEVVCMIITPGTTDLNRPPGRVYNLKMRCVIGRVVGRLYCEICELDALPDRRHEVPR